MIFSFQLFQDLAGIGAILGEHGVRVLADIQDVLLTADLGADHLGIGREGALLHVIGVPAAIGNNDLHSGILSVMD